MSNYIQVPVPEQYVPRVYQLLAELDVQGDSNTTESSANESVVLDEELVRRMYRESHENHRDLLKFMASRPDEWTPTGELLKALGYTSRKSASGLFGAFGKRANFRYGGAKPWIFAWEPGDVEARYMMTGEVSKWILDEASKEGNE
ncbi:MAG: hypothetical protein KDB54_08660 [Solirubrobacterales bacterium]|nr:hypothetical protein [Solirubrobacterales bacterium]MCB0860709.1 hypothetical protein [Solirubrobacterales bacterium]HRV60088.1 hypothetical protein [Solirubrobacterales bacterium]